MSDERTLTTLCRRLDADHALDVDAVDPTPGDVVAYYLDHEGLTDEETQQRANDAWEVLRRLAGWVAIHEGEGADAVAIGVDHFEPVGRAGTAQDITLRDEMTAAGWVLADREIIVRTIDHGATGALAPTCGPRFGADDD